MNKITVDLYDYFKIAKPDGAVGVLNCYTLDNSIEINPERKNPAMLVIPGGGYGFVSYREAEPVAFKYLSEGFSAFVLRYSVAPITYPYPLLEAVMAMNYIRLNADNIYVDKNKISAVGFSAGGHLCAMLGSFWNSPEVAEIFKSQVSARPDAVILGYPVITSSGKAHFGSFDNLCGVDNKELKEKLDIKNLVNKHSAPAFIWATYNDGAVPVKNSLIVADAYEDCGVPFSIHIWGNGTHGLSLANKTVYHDNYFNMLKDETTNSIHKWIELSIEWLNELKLYI